MSEANLIWRLNQAIAVIISTVIQTTAYPALAKPIKLVSQDNNQADIFTCPQDLKTLTALLLKDLPAYGNRVIQRTQDINQAAGIENYLLTASEAEFEPLGLPRLQYDRIDDRDPEQIFFTVLERQYIDGKIVDIQTYHWLFLTQTDSGWRTVILFSRFGNSDRSRGDSRISPTPAPPRETTNGIIGQGIQLWLRDCRADAVRR